MHLFIPEGVNVHVTIGSPAVLGVPGAATTPPYPSGSDAYPRPSGRPLLKGVLTVLLLGGTFVAGTYAGRAPGGAGLGSGRGAAPAAQAALPAPYPGYGALRPSPPEQRAFPDRPLPRETAGADAGQVPEQFAQQLRQPPTVVLPPGQAAPASGKPGKNAFGLED